MSVFLRNSQISTNVAPYNPPLKYLRTPKSLAVLKGTTENQTNNRFWDTVVGTHAERKSNNT